MTMQTQWSTSCTIAQIICLTIAFSRTLKRNYHYYCLIVNLLFGLIVYAKYVLE